MQNRGMFPYRRQGPKKRKNGPPRNKMRGPQKGLPNSARDLLPILQPATKALAQMLAGRTQASGQLGHAQSVLAHAERLIGERAHNRLNPAEREEFFEQLARLRLTLADAAAEAEVQAAEEHVVKPPARQVAHERLKEMALALTQPERPAPAPLVGANGGGGTAERAPVGAPARVAEPEEEVSEASQEAPAAPPPVQTGRAGRLQLPRASAEAAASAVAVSGVGSALRRRSRRAAAEAAAAAVSHDSAGSAPEERTAPEPASESRPSVAQPAVREETAEDEGEKRNGRRPRRPKNKGLPEGWVIDDEGFVVPGPN
jgi:hypothetical protein